jgi:hypothetical protein
VAASTASSGGGGGGTPGPASPITVLLPASAVLNPQIKKQHAFLLSAFAGVGPSPVPAKPFWPKKPPTGTTAYGTFARGVLHDLRLELPATAPTDGKSAFAWPDPMPAPA